MAGSAALAAAALATRASAAGLGAFPGSQLAVGVIGCGGRGTGAAVNSLEASPDTRIVALADVFADRVESCRGELAALEGGLAARAQVAPERCFVGLDAYQKLLASGVDLVILASPPGFRPIHLAAAVERGVHVFTEKPVAVDPKGVRAVIAAGELAMQKKLAIVAGTQRRHERCYLEAMQRLQSGAIGKIVAASCYWNQGGLWMHERQPQWSDAEWQIRNWLYFTWLSGDHIVEQHVHNLDVVNWALGAHPLRATAMGGRQVRTAPAYGQIYDHFAVEYEYPGGVLVSSWSRQIDGCASRVEEVFRGTEGVAVTSPGRCEITGPKPWKFTGEEPNPYVQEHVDLIRSIEAGAPLNEARTVAEATMTAILGRMSAYTGQTITWEQALESKLDLVPHPLELGALAVAEVAMPGKTPFL